MFDELLHATKSESQVNAQSMFEDSALPDSRQHICNQHHIISRSNCRIRIGFIIINLLSIVF